MAELTPEQRAVRERIEGVIAAIAPALDAVLAAGDRVSRIADRDEPQPYPVRAPRETPLLPSPGSRSGGDAA